MKKENEPVDLSTTASSLGRMLACRPYSIISRIQVVVAAGVLFLVAPAARAASYLWQASAGDWSVASNWGGTVPTSSDYAYVVNGGTAGVSSGNMACANLSVANSQGSGCLSITGGTLSDPVAFIGASGAGTARQSGGANLVLGYYGVGLRLANNSGATGTYQLTGTGRLQTYLEQIGEQGVGIFNQSGGTNLANYLHVADFASGTYNLTGAILVLNALTTGNGMSPNFNFGGGVLQASGSFATTVPLTLTGTGGDRASIRPATGLPLRAYYPARAD